jgi:putative endonuclease
MFWVYILQCADGTYYVGSTNDIERRVHHHNHTAGGAHYTKIRRPVSLVYSEEFPSYTLVRKREGELKRLTRLQKIELVSNA